MRTVARIVPTGSMSACSAWANTALHLRAGVEPVDDHLAIDRAGDLDAPIAERRGRRRDAPIAVANRGGLGKEVGTLASVEPRLAFLTRGKQRAQPRRKTTHELGEKR